MSAGLSKRDVTALQLASDADLLAEHHLLTAHLDRLARRWACPLSDCDGRPHEGWAHPHARASQRKPTGEWDTFLMIAGRGFGKTRASAEAVREWVNEAGGQPLRIAVIAKNETQVREVCFEHRRSGLLAVFPDEEQLRYDKSQGSIALHLVNGTVIRGFGATQPDNFRGYEFDRIWGDEYASWPRHTAQEALDTIWFCLRESTVPQVILSTTPKPLPHVKKLLREHADEVAVIEESGEDRLPRTRVIRGSMLENRANLTEAAIRQLERKFAGTRLGRQELEGELLEDVEGALWQGWMFETDQFRPATASHVPELERIVVAVDPATTSGEQSDETGFAVAGRSYPYPFSTDDPEPHGYVLASSTVKATPHWTMREAARLYELYQADAVVIEANNGGDYLTAVMSDVDPRVPCRIVHATRDKRARAAPVAALYEQGLIHHVGDARAFDALETVMTTYVGAPERREKSPDILDALVWALTELFLTRTTRPTAIRTRDHRLKGRR